MIKLNIPPRKRLWIAALIVAGVLLVCAGVAVAATTISNVWQSPKVTVTTPPPPPPPPASQLVISSPDFTSDRSQPTGQAMAFQVNLTNPSPAGAPSYEGVRVTFVISREGSEITSASDVILEYQDETSTWQPIPLTVSSGGLVGHFGPAAGFTVPPGYNVTTNLRATFNAAGIYSAQAWAEN